MDALLGADVWLFNLINQKLAHPLLDELLPNITDLHKISWVVYGLLPAILIFLFWKFKINAIKIILSLSVLIAITDNFNHRVLKPTFERQRPPLYIENTVLRTHAHSGHSFPSNHSINSFAAMSFLSFFVGARPLLLLIAFLIGYSRIYVGVHHPLDVGVGAILGLAFSYLIFWLYQKLFVNRKTKNI